MPDATTLVHFVVYFNPADYPGKYVVRRWEVRGRELIPDEDPLAVVDTLERAHACLPDGVHAWPVFAEDAKQIVEVWG